MAEQKKELTEAQKMILSKVIAKRDASTFVLCVNEEQEAKIEEYKKLIKRIQGQQLNKEQQEALDKLKNEILGIHGSSVYCAHCHKLAKVEGDLDALKYSCDCEDAKKELSTKQAIEAQQAALDKEFYDCQIASTNEAIKLYKEKYADVIDFRKKAFEKLDNDIMNAAEL